MKNNYSIRVVVDDFKKNEIFITNLTKEQAIDRFKFYVDASLELDVSVRVVNMFVGNFCRRCIKLFKNY